MTETLPMRQVREVLRLKYEQRLSHRAIARACGVGFGTVSEYGRRAPAGRPDLAPAARVGRRPTGSPAVPARPRRGGRAAASARHGRGSTRSSIGPA